MEANETTAAGTALAPLPMPTKRDVTDLATLPPSVAPAGLEWHNFTGDRMNIWRMKALCQTAAEPGNELRGEVIPVKHWYVQQVQIWDDARQESADAFRCVLIRPDMSCVAFVSTGVLKSLQSMVEAIGPGPYDPAVNVAIVETQTRRGRRVFAIRPE